MQSTSLRCAVPAVFLWALVGNCVHLFDRGHELEIPDKDGPNLESLQKMEENILGALTSGDFKSLEGVENHTNTSVTGQLTTITVDMMLKINESHDQDVRAIEKMPEPFTRCANPVTALLSSLVPSQTLADKGNEDYESCLESQKAMKNASDSCQDLLETEQKVTEACADDDDNDNMGNPCIPRDSQTYAAWVKEMHKYFQNEKIKVVKAKKECDDAAKKIADMIPKCKAMADEAVAKEEECEEKRQKLISGVCARDKSHEETCSASDDCWRECWEAYKREKAEHQEREKMRKTEWRASKRIECLILTFHEKNQSGLIDSCIQRRHNTDHLNLTFPEVPDPAKCPDKNFVPCSETWKTKYPKVAEKSCKACAHNEE